MARLVLGLLLWLVVGCQWDRPTGPTVNVTGNTGPTTVIVPTGTSNAGGTGPCGATIIPGTACPSTTTNNNAAELLRR